MKILGLLKRKSPQDKLVHLLGDAELPVFPALVLQALSLLRDPDSSPTEIGRLVASDPGLSVRVLQMANSSAYRDRARVSDPGHAVVLLGRRAVESLVLAAAVRGVLPVESKTGFDSERFWRSAARRAALGHSLSDLLHPAKNGLVFSAGLLQDLAIPLLVHRGPDDYGAVLEAWHAEGGSLAEREQQKFGWNHAQVAGLLCQRWEFPSELQQAIRLHHGGEGSDSLPVAVSLVAMLPEGDCENEIEQLVETAQSKHGLSKVRVTHAVEDGLQAAKELAMLFV
jgi:HD-like signal output (HDOD) protein